MSEKNYITPPGFKKLVDELTWLATVERPRVVREVSDAAAEGDRSENAAYIYGKRRLREIDRRMGFLQRRIDAASVVKPEDSPRDRVFFGATVDVEDDDGQAVTYQIVGVDEVEADKGRISWRSPIGRALLGKRVDDGVTVKWHAGERELTVVEIRYGVAPLEALLPASARPKPEPRPSELDEDEDEPDEAGRAEPPPKQDESRQRELRPPRKPRPRRRK